MKKINKKALLGVGAGLLAATVGACCLFKKKDNDEYVDGDVYCEDEYVDVDDSVESEEE